jgi:hypothetical protein
MATALGVGALACAPIAAATPATAARTATPPVTPDCAWGIVINADTLNAFYPDTAATYWVLPFTVQNGLRIKLSGRYPDSRYASFNVYRENKGPFTRDDVPSWRADHLIEPDEGSVNPWRQKAEPGGRFTLTLREDVSPEQVNTLPIAPEDAPEGTENYIVLRVYLPAGGDFGRVPLPEVTFERDGVSVPVPRCAPGRDASRLTRERAAAAVRAAEQPGFARPEEKDGNALFPNADAAYLLARVTPPPRDSDQVVVIRGKAPRHSAGSHPSPWPAPGTDVRYWSMCSNLILLQRPVVVNRVGDEVDYGCRTDDQTLLNAKGEYTYVLGTEAQRSRIESVPGVTFLPFSLDRPNVDHALLLRNMVAAPGFAQAIQNVPDDDNPASAKRVMGPYYPRVGTCALARLRAHGPGACLRG